MRTTSPYALYKSTKDTRNHALWNPSEKSLRNLEVDEAGKLAAFRERFGRTWDAPAVSIAGTPAGDELDAKKRSAEEEEDEDAYSLDELVSRYAVPIKDEKPKGSTEKK